MTKWLNDKIKEGGFSLMEVMVAIFIITVALVGIMSLISAVNASVSASSSKLIAVNLAQEGVEIVKNIRDLNSGDNNWNDWYASIVGTICYYVQYNSTALDGTNQIPCANDAPILKYDSGTGLYGYLLGVDAAYAYKRKITLVKLSNNEIKVTATVTWTEHGRTQSITVEDRLWNWQ